MPRNTLTAERLRELLDYSIVSGRFYRRLDSVAGRYGSVTTARAGDAAGTVHKASGYVYLTVEGRRYLAHRLAWLWVTGDWPSHQVDHENGLRSANAWTNLRAATNPQNNANKGAHRRNTTGLKGVSLHRKTGKWLAQVSHLGQYNYGGLHPTPEAAYAAACSLRTALHGEFAKHI
jgi:hypothetical protein